MARILLVMIAVPLVLVGGWRAYAQSVPTAVSYQGKLMDAAGLPVSDGLHAVRFRLFSAQSGGTRLWDSAAVDVSTAGGVFAVALGSSPMPAITSAVLSSDSIWLEATVGADPALPRVKLQSAPFALRSADIVLPFSKTVTSSQVGFSIANSGTARAGQFEITNASNSSAALYAKTSGTGSSVWAESSTIATPLVAYNTGNPGNIAAYVEIYNSSNPNSALYSKTNGAGSAIYGLNQGTGRAGTFSITNASNSSPALYATTSGTGPVAVLDGKVGVGLSDPNRKLYVVDNASGVTYPLKIDNPHSTTGTDAVGLLFSAGGSGGNVLATDRGKGALVYTNGTTWNRGDFHFLQEPNASSANPTLANAVMTVTNSGNVGIGQTNPTTKLEVNGGATVTGNLSVGGTVNITAATRYLTLAGCDFRPMMSDLVYSGSFAVTGETPSTGFFFAAPVHLPAGAVVTEVRAWLTDNVASEMTIKLQRAAASTPATAEDMASFTSTGTGAGIREFSTATITNATVDSQNYAYLVRASWTTPADASLFVLYRVRIAYAVSSLPG